MSKSLNFGAMRHVPRDSVEAEAVPLGDSGKASKMVPSRCEPTRLGINLHKIQKKKK